MLSWQRRLRIALGLFVVAFAIVLVASFRHSSRRAAPPPSVPKADAKAIVQGTKGHVVWSSGSQLDVLVDYEQLLSYSDGSSKLSGVTAKLPQREKRDFTIKAREARIGNNQEAMDLEGAIELTSNDGLVLRTERASYTKSESLVRAPGPVSFSQNRTSGTSVGMTYDQRADVLGLLDQAVIHVAADEKGQGAADIESGAATFARRDKFIHFERGVKIVRGGETTTTEDAVAYLTEDGEHVRLFALRGSSRVVGEGKTAGSLKAMAARDIDLAYAPDGQTLQHAVLTGGGTIEIASDTPAAVRRIAGESIDLTLAPDGATITGLVARERVRLDLPAENGTPARVIRSAALQGSGEAGKGLTSAVFSGGDGLVEFRETPPAPAAARVARSSTMTLAMQGGFSSIESAQFAGGVRFEEGDLSAVAREATYALAKGTLKLTGSDAKTGRPPQVVDEQATIEAKKIDIALEGRKIVAVDAVKSDLRPKKAPAAAAPAAPQGGRGATPKEAGQTRLPAIMKQDQPVSATADRMDYDGDASHATYTGHAQLWQGETTVKGDRVVLDDQKGDLSAFGNVVTTMMLEQANDRTKAKEQVRSTARAKEMVYTDEARRAVYTGGAHLNGPQGDLAADKIELYLKESGSEVDRLEAYTSVNLKTPEGRKATGARLTYVSADERYTMTGPAVKITEECRETTGKTLTFFRSVDRIIVDGNEQRRTETKGVGACGSTPRSPTEWPPSGPSN
jgi:lipopolysaccharide transport protein LptA/LPS export ABC transporter protein LptC